MLIWCCSWLITPTDSPQFRVKPRRLGSGGVVVSHLDSYHKPSFLSLPTVSLHLSGTACERELEESGVTERWRWAKAQQGRSRCAQLLGRSEGFWFSQISCKISSSNLGFLFFCLKNYWGSDAFHFTPLSRHCTSLLPPFKQKETPIVLLVILTQDQEMDGHNTSPYYWT